MNEQLAGVIDELRAAQRGVHGLYTQLPESAWHQRPGVGRWSAAECLVHLNLTSAAFIPLLRRGLHEARRAVESHRYRRNLTGWVMSKAIAPGGYLRITTTTAFVPAAIGEVGECMSEFDCLQDEIVACVEQGRGLALDEVFLISPFHARLRYNVYAAVRLIPRHQQRHLRQAAQAAMPADTRVHAFAI